MTIETAHQATGLLLGDMPYVRIGNGPRPLLIIPGAEAGTGDTGWLSRQALRLAFNRYARAHSVYIVQRKRGLPLGYTTADMATDYARALQALVPSGRRAYVIGFSTGGLIAQHLAAQAPALIDRLVLVVTAARLSAEGRRLVQQWRALALARQWVALASAMSEVLLEGAASKRLLRGFMRVFGSLLVAPPPYADDFVITMEADLAHDATALLPALTMPTLVLGGEHDPFFPAPLLEQTAAALPNAVLRVYAGAGHGLMKLHKRRFDDDVLAFLTATALPAEAPGA